jgi:hypothetical protein
VLRVDELHETVHVGLSDARIGRLPQHLGHDRLPPSRVVFACWIAVCMQISFALQTVEHLFLQSNYWNSQDCSIAALQAADGYAIQTQTQDGRLAKGEDYAAC